MGMPRLGWMGVGLGLALGLGTSAGVVAALHWAPPPAEREERPVVERIREVARLETLDVAVYRKVTFEPEVPPAGSVAGDLANWAAHAVRPRQGKAIVFGEAHLSVDLRRTEARAVGRTVYVVLPDVTTRVELRPQDTAVYESNLDAQQLQQLLHHGLLQLQADVGRDPALKNRARESARRAMTTFLVGAGFSDVRFVDALPAGGAAS
jgi:hypothetical protein